MGKENFTKSKMISDFDLYLTCEGTHRNLDEVLGARPVKSSTGLIEGYYFALWAPNAKCVSVVGDFNGWDNKANVMAEISDGIYEAKIDNVKIYDCYKYAIETKNGDIIMKADPYACHAETRPGTASKVYELGKYRWSDEKWKQASGNGNILEKPVNI